MQTAKWRKGRRPDGGRERKEAGRQAGRGEFGVGERME